MSSRPLHTGTDQPRPLIAARRLSKRYRMGEETVDALRDVSLEIAEGEMVAIMGPSGSGKSTLLNMIGTLDHPTDGELIIAGTSVRGLADDALARLRNETIGFVFQQFHLLPRTSALEQVMLPLLYRKVPVRQAEPLARERLRQVGLELRMHHYPTQLSGGQQQRVAIARALVTNPKLILADEPTGALDTATTAEIMSVLCDLNAAGMTVIVVTHEPEVADYARRRILFRDGRIVVDERNDKQRRPQETMHGAH